LLSYCEVKTQGGVVPVQICARRGGRPAHRRPGTCQTALLQAERAATGPGVHIEPPMRRVYGKSWRESSNIFGHSDALAQKLLAGTAGRIVNWAEIRSIWRSDRPPLARMRDLFPNIEQLDRRDRQRALHGHGPLAAFGARFLPSGVCRMTHSFSAVANCIASL